MSAWETLANVSREMRTLKSFIIAIAIAVVIEIESTSVVKVRPLISDIELEEGGYERCESETEEDSTRAE